MLVFKMEMRVHANAPETEEMKQTFIKNAEEIVQQGLTAMTVPDWEVTITDLKEE